jgi:hypothetical protein
MAGQTEQDRQDKIEVVRRFEVEVVVLVDPTDAPTVRRHLDAGDMRFWMADEIQALVSERLESPLIDVEWEEIDVTARPLPPRPPGQLSLAESMVPDHG